MIEGAFEKTCTRSRFVDRQRRAHYTMRVGVHTALHKLITKHLHNCHMSNGL